MKSVIIICSYGILSLPTSILIQSNRQIRQLENVQIEKRSGRNQLRGTGLQGNTPQGTNSRPEWVIFPNLESSSRSANFRPRLTSNGSQTTDDEFHSTHQSYSSDSSVELPNIPTASQMQLGDHINRTIDFAHINLGGNNDTNDSDTENASLGSDNSLHYFSAQSSHTDSDRFHQEFELFDRGILLEGRIDALSNTRVDELDSQLIDQVAEDLNTLEREMMAMPVLSRNADVIDHLNELQEDVMHLRRILQDYDYFNSINDDEAYAEDLDGINIPSIPLAEVVPINFEVYSTIPLAEATIITDTQSNRPEISATYLGSF